MNWGAGGGFNFSGKWRVIDVAVCDQDVADLLTRFKCRQERGEMCIVSRSRIDQRDLNPDEVLPDYAQFMDRVLPLIAG